MFPSITPLSEDAQELSLLSSRGLCLILATRLPREGDFLEFTVDSLSQKAGTLPCFMRYKSLLLSSRLETIHCVVSGKEGQVGAICCEPIRIDDTLFNSLMNQALSPGLNGSRDSLSFQFKPMLRSLRQLSVGPEES